MLQILLALCASLASQAAINFANPDRESREFGFVGMERVKINSPAGRITITPMPLNKTLIVFNKRNFTDECSTFAQRSIDLLDLTVAVTRPVGARCEADIEIQVPKDVNLEITTDTGTVELTGMEGNLNFTIGSGSLTATGGTLKSATGKVGSGRVDLKSVAGGGLMNMGTGEVNVTFAADPKGEFLVKSGSGNINLMFPKGMKLKADLGSAAGTLENEFAYDATSPFALSVNTGAGDVRVKSY